MIGFKCAVSVLVIGKQKVSRFFSFQPFVDNLNGFLSDFEIEEYLKFLIFLIGEMSRYIVGSKICFRPVSELCVEDLFTAEVSLVCEYSIKY
jgi:hypothetical protein